MSFMILSKQLFYGCGRKTVSKYKMAENGPGESSRPK